jgi:uncharacterized protein YecT (DUF1311 family)
MKKSLLVFVVFSMFHNYAFAVEDCSSLESDSEVLKCALKNKNSAEKKLNQSWSDAKKRIAEAYQSDSELGKTYQQTFLDSQRAWLKYRDSHCKLEAFLAKEGSIANQTLTSSCLARLDKQRTHQIQEMPYQ